MSPDPSGMAAGDPRVPQMWNRYAYVANNPVVATDRLGLDLDWCGDFDASSVCNGEGDYGWSWGVDWGIGVVGGIIRNGGFGGANGPSQPLGGERLGIPDYMKLPNPTLLGLLFPSMPQCDFGPCVAIGNDFLAGITGNGTTDSPWIYHVEVWAPFLAVTPWSCHFPNLACFKFYGNWGGPGWTGGQFKPYETLTTQEKQYLLPPIDAQDACYMQHDLCYSRIRVSGGAFGTCDFELQQCLHGINAGGFGNAHSWGAEPIFSICEMLHVPCHLNP
jgi:hypothetical protein